MQTNSSAPSSSAQAAKTETESADGTVDVGLTWDEADLLQEAFRSKWRIRPDPWSSSAIVGLLIAISYDIHSWPTWLAICLLVAVIGIAMLGEMMPTPEQRLTRDLLQRYIARDPAAQAKLATLDGSKLKEKMAGKSQTPPSP